MEVRLWVAAAAATADHNFSFHFPKGKLDSYLRPPPPQWWRRLRKKQLWCTIKIRKICWTSSFTEAETLQINRNCVCKMAGQILPSAKCVRDGGGVKRKKSGGANMRSKICTPAKFAVCRRMKEAAWVWCGGGSGSGGGGGRRESLRYFDLMDLGVKCKIAESWQTKQQSKLNSLTGREKRCLCQKSREWLEEARRRMTKKSSKERKILSASKNATSWRF